jgi:hypothetical protein
MSLLRWGAFALMSLAILSGAFAPVSPDWVAPYLKAAVVAFTGLAGLFMQPPAFAVPELQLPPADRSLRRTCRAATPDSSAALPAETPRPFLPETL